jgi:hypothetical protein
MMMKMLVAGGLEALTDNLRSADDDNPNGYFEFERVKKLDEDNAWLQDACGKVVKIVSSILKHLPPHYNYNIIFMRRKIEEVLASQKKMMIRRGEQTDSVSDEKLAEIFQRHSKDIESWLAAQPNIKTLYFNYNEAIDQPDRSVQLVNDFLREGLDVEAMAAVINRTLYRQRG